MADESHIESKFYSLNPNDFQHLPLKQWDEVGTCVFHFVQHFAKYVKAPGKCDYEGPIKLADFNFNRIHRKLTFTVVREDNPRQWYFLDKDRDADHIEIYLSIVAAAYSRFSSRYKVSDLIIDQVGALRDKYKKINFIKDGFADVLDGIFSTREINEQEKTERYTSPMNVIYGYGFMSPEEMQNIALYWTQTKQIRDWCLNWELQKLRLSNEPALHMWAAKMFEEHKRNLNKTVKDIENAGAHIRDPYQMILR